ncbi:MAG: hypothetical protein ABIS01_13780 [Ferruginibacter sp.]
MGKIQAKLKRNRDLPGKSLLALSEWVQSSYTKKCTGWRKIKDAVLQENYDAKIILYGLRASGTELQGPDWNILVSLNKPIVNFKDEQKFRHKLFDREFESGESISTFVESQSDCGTRLSVTPLFNNKKSEGIYL